jgi:hypothetical protein
MGRQYDKDNWRPPILLIAFYAAGSCYCSAEIVFVCSALQAASIASTLATRAA